MRSVYQSLGSLLICLGLLSPAFGWEITILPEKSLGAIRIMNAVNNGPIKGLSSQTMDNFYEYKALKIPYARLHDSGLFYGYGLNHTVDVANIFPNFDADENDPKNYDFTLTDNYVKTIREAGTEPYYRLGASIEHWIKKYNVNPPKDYAKWARICEHIVRHYNEGWANGYRWNIRYWEIWNEPDLGGDTDGRQSATWTGTPEEFLKFYKTVSLHLRKCFGDSIKIGGPAFTWPTSWADLFLPYCAKEKLPLDFYSWHRYNHDPKEFGKAARQARELMDKNGFTKAESHLNEWNYVVDFCERWLYSLDVMSGSRVLKGASFIAATMSVGQDSPVDMMMYYDARLGTGMNGIFKRENYKPNLGYYPFLIWGKLLDLGTQVSTKGGDDTIYTTAAKDEKGNLGLLVTHYLGDEVEAAGTKELVLQTIPGYDWSKARFHLTDAERTYTEVTPAYFNGGKPVFRLSGNWFLYAECAK